MKDLHRFFTDLDIYNDNTIALDEDVSRKIISVLRLKITDEICLQNSIHMATAKIVTITKNQVIVTVASMRELIKPDYTFEVYQAIAKREYMDFIVEKYSELGVTKIIPIITSRSINELKDKTLARYKTIAKQAVLQSEGEFLPEITKPIRLDKIELETTDNFLFHERVGIKNMPAPSCRNISIMIGAEGGFADSEVELLTAKGFVAYNPIKKILKAETASVVFASNLLIQLYNS